MFRTFVGNDTRRPGAVARLELRLFPRGDADGNGNHAAFVDSIILLDCGFTNDPPPKRQYRSSKVTLMTGEGPKSGEERFG